jgi:hypothetical protein
MLSSSVVVFSILALAASNPDPPVAPDALVRLASSAPLMLCANCQCCDGQQCNEKGGSMLTPYGIVEPSYCGTGCELSGSCGGFAAVHGVELSDVLAKAWHSAAAGDMPSIGDLAFRYGDVIQINVARGAVQLRNCSGAIVAHFTIGTAQALAALNTYRAAT